MNMNEILKWGLVAGAAWFLIDHFQKQQQAVLPPAANGGYLPPAGQQPSTGGNGGAVTNSGAGNGATNGGASNGSGQLTIAQQLAQAANTTTGLNWDQWNYYLHNLTSSYAAEPVGFDRSKAEYQSMTVEQFTAAAGLSGLGNLQPLYRALARGNEWLV